MIETILGLGGTTPTPVTVNGHGEKMEDDERATRDRGNEEEEGIDVMCCIVGGGQTKKRRLKDEKELQKSVSERERSNRKEGEQSGEEGTE